MKGNWILIEAYIAFSLRACLKKGLPLHGDIGRCKGMKQINSKGNMKVLGLRFIRLGVGALRLGSWGERKDYLQQGSAGHVTTRRFL